MKQLIKVLCVVLVIVGSAFAQALDRYDQRQLNIMMEFIRQYGSHSQYNDLRNQRDPRTRLGMAALTAMAVATNPSRNAAGMGRINFLADLDRLNQDLEAAQNPAERRRQQEEQRRQEAERSRQAEERERERARQEQEQRRRNTFLYSEIFSRANEHFSKLAPVKDQFESTVDFSKRLNAHQDSAKYYFDQFAISSVKKILAQANNAWLEALDINNYDADKGTWAMRGSVASIRRNPRENFNSGSWTDKVELKISPQEARSLSENGRSLFFQPTNIYMVDYVIYPTVMTFTNRADATKRYVLNFPRKQGGQDIVFRGSELWADNPKARNLVVNFNDVAGEIYADMQREVAEQQRQAAEQQRIQAEQQRMEAEQQQVRQEQQQWARRMTSVHPSSWVLRTADNQIIQFVMKQLFPVPNGIYEIQGKKVAFKRYTAQESQERSMSRNMHAVAYITDQNGKEHRVYAWALARNGTITNKWYGARFNSSAMTNPQLGFLGFGIFDTAPRLFPPLITPAPQAQATPSAAEIAQAQAAEQQRVQDSIQAEQTRIAQEQAAAELQRIQAEQARLATIQAPPPPAPTAPAETVIETPQQTETTPVFVQETVALQPTQPIPTQPTTLAADTRNRNSAFLLSVRPELVMGTAVANVGLNVEIGAILENGLFLSGDFGGGAIYFGGGFNIGYCINQDGNAKNVIGATLGARFALKPVEFMIHPPISTTEFGINTSLGGIFHKLMIGGQNNLDITNRLMFGHRSNPVIFRVNNNQFFYEDGVNITWSLGIGYTLTRKR
jgi:hypothetical protein